MAVAAFGQLNLDESPLWGSRSIECFEKLEQIGEGTYGSVFFPPQTVKFLLSSILPLIWIVKMGSLGLIIAK